MEFLCALCVGEETEASGRPGRAELGLQSGSLDSPAWCLYPACHSPLPYSQFPFAFPAVPSSLGFWQSLEPGEIAPRLWRNKEARR